MHVIVLLTNAENIVVGVHAPAHLVELGDLNGHSLKKATEWLTEKGWEEIDAATQVDHAVHKNTHWADYNKHFFELEEKQTDMSKKAFLQGDEILLVFPAVPEEQLHREIIKCTVLKGDNEHGEQLHRADTYVLRANESCGARSIKKDDTLQGIKLEQIIHR